MLESLGKALYMLDMIAHPADVVGGWRRAFRGRAVLRKGMLAHTSSQKSGNK